MYGTDSSSDGEINLGYAYSFYNANHEQSTSWIGPRDLDTNKIPSITNFSSGDFNGDGITDYIASFTNDDYYYPSNYAFLAITLGGPNIFPHYDPTIETWSGTAQWNNVLETV